MQKSYRHTYAAFTLIEMMVVMTILAILSLATYLPYAHHQKKVLLQQATKEITQSLTEARNLAINGVQTNESNLNIGLYFGENAQEIIYYTLKFDEIFDIQNLPTESEIYKTKILPAGIQIQDISLVGGQKILITFDAISGDLGVQTENGSSIAIPETIDFLVSYGNTTSSVLQQKIQYYTRSYISDY